MEILGYFIHREDEELNANTVMVVIDEAWSNTHELTHYCPVVQHGGLTKGYFEECIPITREQYIMASKGFYTPSDYLKLYELQPFKTHLGGYEIVINRENKVGYIDGEKIASDSDLEQIFLTVGRTLEEYGLNYDGIRRFWELAENEY